MGFGYSGGIIEVDNEKDLPTLRKPDNPNARYDYYQNGNLKSSRFTNASGIPTKSVHNTNHGNPKQHPKVPHVHNWGWVNKQWAEFSEWY